MDNMIGIEYEETIENGYKRIHEISYYGYCDDGSMRVKSTTGRRYVEEYPFGDYAGNYFKTAIA